MYACEYGDRLRLAVHVHVRERQKMHEKETGRWRTFQLVSNRRCRESDMSVVVAL